MYPEDIASDVTPTALQQTRWKLIAAILAVSCTLLWPAFWNGLPLLFPDSLEYLGYGYSILGRLLLVNRHHLTLQFARSEIYSASLGFLHFHAMLWPIVVVQAVITAWILWLAFRTLQRRDTLRVYVIASIALGALSGVAWYVSFVMPDILGPWLYLSFWLLVVASDELGRGEIAVLIALAWFAATAHATHLLLAAGLCIVLGFLWGIRWPGMKAHGRQVLLITGITVAAMLAQLGVHAELYGRSTLFGNAPPFLMARMIGDGPARLFLEQHCDNFGGAICTHVNALPQTAEAFLWPPTGIWQSATPAEKDMLRNEQTPLLRATLRTYPMQQVRKSAENFYEMLISIGPDDFWPYTDILTPGNLDFAGSGLSARYPATRQAHNALPQKSYRYVQATVTALSAVTILLFVPSAIRRKQHALLLLATMVLFVVIVNAFLSGVVSCVDPRLQGRVSWLIVLLALLMIEKSRAANINGQQPTI